MAHAIAVDDSALFLDILLVTAAAFIGGALAHALRLPTIIGFLVAGVVIGPGTPGPVGEVEDVAQAAELGVILLMFGIGLEFSFRELVEYRRLTFLGGGGQVVAALLLGVGVGRLLGFGLEEALVLGFLVVGSSTVVAVKVLEGNQQLKTIHGLAAINISIFQDLVAVLFVIVVPSLGTGDLNYLEFLFAIGKGLLLIAVTYILSTRVLPVLWRRLALARSRELSLLAALTLAIGFAAGSGLLGLSFAFGAFLAGLAVSENEYGFTTLSDIIPLRDVFASVFFVSMGMLIEPQAAWEDPATVVAIVLVIVVGKAVIATLTTRLAGLALGTAILTGLILAQVGEFSFVIARTALHEGVIGDDLVSTFLIAAVVSIVLSPFLLDLGPVLITFASRLPPLRTAMAPPIVLSDAVEPERLRRHVVIGGFGDTAGFLIRSLRGRSLPFVVIDYNPYFLDEAKRESIPFIYGDATRSEVLEQAAIREARVFAVTFSNAIDARVATYNARNLNPNVDIVSHGVGVGNHFALRQAGAAEVVDPGFEAGLEFVRHVLHRYGVDAREISALQARWRAEYYRAAEQP